MAALVQCLESYRAMEVSSMATALAIWLASTMLQATGGVVRPPSDRVSVTFTQREQQHDVPLTLVRGCIVIEARVNGRTVSMLIDNAAERSFIDSTLASEIGLIAETIPGSVNTLTGKLPKQLVRGVQLDIPGQFTSNEPMYSIDLKPASTRFGQSIGVVIGHDLLSFLAVGVNTQTRKLFFAPGGVQVGGPATASLSIVPLERDGDKDLTTVRVDGKDVRVLLDLGYGRSISLTPDVLRAVAASGPGGRQGHLVGANGGEVTVAKTTIASLDLGHSTYENVEADVRSINDAGISGVLGSGALTRQQFLLDVKGGKLYLRPF